MTLTTPEEELRRAERAKQILNDPLVRSALDEIRATLIEQWRTAPVKDRDLKEELWALYVAAHKFEQLLYSHIETGKLASVQVEESRSLLDKLRAHM